MPLPEMSYRNTSSHRPPPPHHLSPFSRQANRNRTRTTTREEGVGVVRRRRCRCMDIMAYLETGANAEAEEAIMAMTAANAILDIMVIKY